MVSAVYCLLRLRSSIFLQLEEGELLFPLRLFLLAAEREVSRQAMRLPSMMTYFIVSSPRRALS